MEYIFNTILTAICAVNRRFHHDIWPVLKELDTIPMYIDDDITS